jgi:hypothetical protein
MRLQKSGAFASGPGRFAQLPSIVLCVLAVCGTASADTTIWQPRGGHTPIPIWPGVAPDLQPVPGPEPSRRAKSYWQANR